MTGSGLGVSNLRTPWFVRRANSSAVRTRDFCWDEAPVRIEVIK